MSASPLISVVVRVRDGARFPANAIASVLAQTYRPLEVIVVDDGSTDESAAIARAFSDVRVIGQGPQGVAAARNTGVQASRGELIAFLDADDTWLPGKLVAQARYLSEHPRAGYVLCRMKNVLEEGVMPPPWLNPFHLTSDPVAHSLCAMLAGRARGSEPSWTASTARPASLYQHLEVRDILFCIFSCGPAIRPQVPHPAGDVVVDMPRRLHKWKAETPARSGPASPDGAGRAPIDRTVGV
jgi:glycosyltransferase involved in cell wall biosynthesis